MKFLESHREFDQRIIEEENERLPMEFVLLVIGILLLLVVLSEYILWRLFLRRTRGITFPHESDVSALRFFSIGRMRMIAAIHTTTLLVLVFVFLFFLW